jgi:hypothetical protein
MDGDGGIRGDIGSKGERCFDEPKKGMGSTSSALSGEMSDKYGRGVGAGNRERYLISIFLGNFFFLSWSEKRRRGRKLVSLLTDDTGSLSLH